MRLAILGDHPDGWAVARAMVASGRHELSVYQSGHDLEIAGQFSAGIRRQSDLEEILADPQIDAIIVAASLTIRLDVLRRVLQSERSALCVHPVDSKPDGGYEINLLQGDLHQVVIPILPDGAGWDAPALQSQAHVPIVDCQIAAGQHALTTEAAWFPGWTLLRRLGGEIAEVQALADGEEALPGMPVLVQGRFAAGGLFRVLFQPGARAEPIHVRALSSAASESVPWTVRRSDDWETIARVFEEAVAALPATARAAPGAGRAVDDHAALSWLDEIRCLELDDAVRRSVERRRASTLDYQEATEEVGFKGTMTLVGCGLIWVVLLLLMLSAWFPWLGWLIAPVLIGFLGLQMLRWLVPLGDASQKRR